MRIFFIVFFIVLPGIGQELPPIRNYSPLDYQGENQNWSIAQDADKHIYIANNHSLLEFNGERWKTYQSPNASIFRSVASSADYIFTGQYMEFGYWQRNLFGELTYTSISNKLNRPMLEDEEFWDILSVGEWVLFRSLDRIYSYNLVTEQFKIIDAKTAKAHLFELHGIVFYQDKDLGVFKILNGRPVLVVEATQLNEKSVVGLYEVGKDLVVILEDGTFVKFIEGIKSDWTLPAYEKLKGLSVYNSLVLDDGSIILGTISKGLFHIDRQGNLLYVINQSKGLANNTILSLLKDFDGNLWLGLDNGVSTVNINSPFNEYVDNIGQLGLVYASILHKGNLYLGTNQGLFVKPFEKDDGFKLISGTDGQVWTLKVLDGILFCGHNNGTYIIEEATATRIATLPGTWNLKAVPKHQNLILQGNYDGLSVLEKRNGTWEFRNKIEGFDTSSRFVELISETQIIVNHEYKGLFNVHVNDDYTHIKNIETHPIMGHGSSMVNYRGNLIYSSLDGIFAKESGAFKFQPDSTLINLFFKQASGLSSILLPDEGNDRLWAFTNKGLSYLGPQTFSSSLKLETIPIPAFFRRSLGVSGFENISSLGNDRYLVGVSNGYVVLDLAKTKEKFYEVKLNEVQVSKFQQVENGTLLKNGVRDIQLDHNQNTLSFSYSVPQYNKYAEVSYQFRMLGLTNDWSTWSTKADHTFVNLAHGAYEFQVRGKVGNSITQNILKYTFGIKRPWYKSIAAMIAYSLFVVLLLLGLNKLYKAYYTNKQKRILSIERKKLKRKKLKTEKKLVQLKNQNLKTEIEAKNRELAVATMSMIKKNEFLNGIKSQLSKAEHLGQIKSVITTINRNLNNEDDWKFFEEAFNNADKDFLKKIKRLHPSLTPNDLKLCAYLRLNLTSKEIAPLLNISIRSVEVKRYRLRKKMDLSHESSLTDYIMSQ